MYQEEVDIPNLLCLSTSFHLKLIESQINTRRTCMISIIISWDVVGGDDNLLLYTSWYIAICYTKSACLIAITSLLTNLQNVLLRGLIWLCTNFILFFLAINTV